MIALTLFLLLSSVSSLRAASELTFGSGGLSFTEGATSYDVGVGYQYGLFSWLEIGPHLSYQKTSHKETSASNLTIIIGPTFNLGGFSNGFFLWGGVAIKSGSAEPENTSATTTSADSEEGDGDPTGTGVGFFIGKRFPLIDGFLFRPSVGVTSVGTFGITLNLLQFSLVM